MEGGEGERRMIGQEYTSHTCTCMHVCLIHTYTIIPLHVALSTLQGGLGVKERAQGYPYFLGGRMVSWWMDVCTFGNGTNNSYSRQECSSVMDLFFKGPHPSLPFLLPSSLPPSLSSSPLPPSFSSSPFPFLFPSTARV